MDDEEFEQREWGQREDSRVMAWRYRMLRAAGYDRHNAQAVAECLDVDLHRAVEIVERGCSPLQAVEILL